MESILIFGGGDNQKTLITGAKELGYRTIVIDPNENAIGKKYADIFEVVAPKDYEGTKKIAEKYNIKGIVTCQMENPLLLMAQLAEEKKYRFPTVEGIKRARDKFLMKQAFIKYEVPCANGYLISSPSEIDDKKLLFPAILKPVDSFSSRGVFRIENKADLERYFNLTVAFSSTGKAIVEEFIEGHEYSVESVTNNGKTFVIQITEKEITPFPHTVEMAHMQPANISDFEKEAIEEIVKKAIIALELDNCATHAELKITNKGPKMIEIGARLGGDYITSHLVPLSTGINVEKLSVQIAMNDFIGVPLKNENAAVIRYLNLPAGKTVIKVEQWSDLLNDEHLIHANIFLKEGELTSEITDSAKRAGFVIVKSNNRHSAIENALKYSEILQSKIKVL